MNGLAKSGGILMIVGAAYSLINCLFSISLIVLILQTGMFSNDIDLVFVIMILLLIILPIVAIVQAGVCLAKPTRKKRLQSGGISAMMTFLLLLGVIFVSVSLLGSMILFLLATIFLFFGQENNTSTPPQQPNEPQTGPSINPEETF